MLSLPVLIRDPINCWHHPVIFFVHLGSSPGTESQWLGLSSCGWYKIHLTIFVRSVSTCNVSTQKKGEELLSNKAVIFTVIFLTVATSSMSSFLQDLYYSALSDCRSLVAAVSHTNTHMRTLSYLNISLLHKCLQKTISFSLTFCLWVVIRDVYLMLLLLSSHGRAWGSWWILHSGLSSVTCSPTWSPPTLYYSKARGHRWGSRAPRQPHWTANSVWGVTAWEKELLLFVPLAGTQFLPHMLQKNAPIDPPLPCA